MVAKLQKIKRFSLYLTLLATAAVLSLLGNKRSDEVSSDYSLIPPPSAPVAHADIGGCAPLDTESSADSADDGGASACCDSDGGCGC